MHEHLRRPDASDRSQPHGTLGYLVYFAVPPYLAAFVIAAVDPRAGLALLATFMIIVVVLNVLLFFVR
jgi:hypothetical protein